MTVSHFLSCPIFDTASVFIIKCMRSSCICLWWRNNRWQTRRRLTWTTVQADWNVFPLWTGWSLGSSV